MSSESKLARRLRAQRIWHRSLAYSLDLAAFALSTFLAFELRFDGALPAQYFYPMGVALCIWAGSKVRILHGWRGKPGKLAAYFSSTMQCGLFWLIRRGRYWVDWSYFFWSGHGAFRVLCTFSIG